MSIQRLDSNIFLQSNSKESPPQGISQRIDFHQLFQPAQKICLPEAKKINPEDLESKESVSDLLPDAKELVELELVYAKEMILAKKRKEPLKVKPELLIARKNFHSTKSLSANEVHEKTIRLRTALYHAWKELTLEQILEAVLPEDHKEIHFFVKQQLEKECLQTIERILLKKQVAQQRKIKCIGLNDPIPSNDKAKFSCAADPSCPDKTYPNIRAMKTTQNWWIKNGEKSKQIKNQLKAQIAQKINEDLKGISTGLDPNTFSYQVAYASFSKQLSNCRKKDPTFETQKEVINEIAYLLDDFCKNKGALSEDLVMRELYAEFAYKSKEGPALYNYTEECKKKSKNAKAEIDEHLVQRLEAFLVTAVNHLKSEMVSSKNVLEKQIFDNEEIDFAIEYVSKYFIELIKIHKNLSHNRFINLFNIHTLFVQRLYLALEKLDLVDRDGAKKMIEESVSPNLTLLETKLHRKAQGKHDEKEAKDARKHRNLANIIPYVLYLTSFDPLDWASYEAAHVVPFPALFVRKNSGILSKQHVTSKYISSSKEEREKMFQEDLEFLFEAHKNDPQAYMNSALDMIFKITLEESSQTVHVPSAFNQELDGVSEKLIPMHDSFKEENTLLEKNQSLTSYTQKIYKYILGLNLFSLAKEPKKITYEEVIDKEQNYIFGVKISLARRIELLVRQPKSVTNMILACSLCNIMYGLKNSEALGKKDFTDGEDELSRSFDLMKSWVFSEMFAD